MIGCCMVNPGRRLDQSMSAYKLFQLFGLKQVEEPDDWLRYGNPWEKATLEFVYLSTISIVCCFETGRRA